MARFPDIYYETSISGGGLHGIGFGYLPPEIKKPHPKGIGLTNHSGYFVMTGNPLPGHETLGLFGEGFESWVRETFNASKVVNASPSIPSTTIDDHELIRRLRNERNGYASRLLDGDRCHHHSMSEAREALAWKCCFYRAPEDQITRVVRVAGLWNDTDTDEERDRKAAVDAKSAIETYPGPYYDDRPHLRVVDTQQDAPSNDNDLEGFSREQLISLVRAKDREIEELSGRIESQARMIRYERSLRKDIETILATPELEAGPKLTAIGLCLELVDQQERGRQPDKERGYQIPAVWVSRRVGLTPKTTSRHMKELSARRIIDRQVVNLTKGEEVIDNETGEILTVDVPRKVGFIASTPEAIVTNIADYRRQKDGEGRDELGKLRHGGKRLPYCEKHPNAGTITHTITECAECGEILDRDRAEHTADEIFASHAQTDEVSDDRPAASAGKLGIPKLGIPNKGVGISLDVPNLGTPSDSTDSETDEAVRRCTACGVVLASDEDRVCASCAEEFRRRDAEQAERHRQRLRLGRICAECDQPTGSPQELYCAKHRGQANAGMVAS